MKMKFEDAKYSAQILKEYKNNPFIEALPPIQIASNIYDSLLKDSLFDEEEKSLNVDYRYHLIQRYNYFFQPVAFTLELEKKLSMLIRSGYIERNPNVKLNNLYQEEINRTITYANSFAVLGYPGMGKSRTLELLLNQYPQVILHSKPINRLQISWLKINCPHDGSLKTLCITFFKTIDELLGTDYYKKFGNNKLNVSAMVTNMAHLAKVHAIGVLVIDEIQHLLVQNVYSKPEQMMNYFVTLTNTTGIPTILVGTMKAQRILQNDLRQARRSSGLGDIILENYKEMDDDWEVIVESLWRNQFLQKSTKLSKEVRNILYQESQGIIDILIKLFWLSQLRAVELEIDYLTPALIKDVSREELKLIKPMINALKSGRKSEIYKFDDIIPINLDKFKQVKTKETVKEMRNIEFTKFEVVMNYLKPLNLESNKVGIIVKHILKNNPKTEMLNIMKSVLLQLDKEENKGLPPYIYEKLIQHNEGELHTLLVEENLIVSPLDDPLK